MVQNASLKIDLYSNFILTVIVACLICLLFRDAEIVASSAVIYQCECRTSDLSVLVENPSASPK
jgi:hypothetical protein